MDSVTVTIIPDELSKGVSVELMTPDVVTALAVADINVDHGMAELRVGPTILARLRKHGEGHAAYWEVN